MARSLNRVASARFGAACCLPAAVLSVLLSLPTALARAAATPAGRPATTSTYRPPTLKEQIAAASTHDLLTLQLFVGGPVSGRFAGFIGDWSDTVASELRYANWRTLQPGPLPRIGEALVVGLASGDSLHGTFEGPWPLGLALRLPGSPVIRPVRAAEFVWLRSTEGTFVASTSEFAERLADAPALVAVGLDQGATGAVLVARSNIASVAGVMIAGDTSAQIAMGAIFGIALGVLVCAALIHETADEAANDVGTCPIFGDGSRSLDHSFGRATPSAPQAMWRKGDTRRP